ncbi:hypothetical protein [Pseudaestuariivita atlantica]|uniref:Uncharacterized protein n=1 Tax=Pseudaestuariivita atlantica TaxID=1317121 RepID=A0A0L1JRZ5_9RHOB|nr:hypothetical protein [Pseudaestuariivita atlantica]KNG94183.1 hypothetical protein ATO11_08140 [Pseudaestuariivita atlantica]
MKAVTIIGAVVAALVIAGGVYMIDIDQTQEAQLPEVKIEGGQLPEYDAEVGSVEVGSTTTEVTVPEVEVTTDQVELTTPTIEINPPSDEDFAQN